MWNGKAETAQVNQRYLAEGCGMLLSVFEVGPEKLWVVSHIGGGEEYTTLLRPDEY